MTADLGQIIVVNGVMTFRALDCGTLDGRVSPPGDCNFYYMYGLLPARETRRSKRTAICIHLLRKFIEL